MNVERLQARWIITISLCVIISFSTCGDGGALSWIKDRISQGRVAAQSDRENSRSAFSDLNESARKNLIRLAKLAATAYPDGKIPKGYRPFAGADWERCVLGRHYEGCRFADDGFLNVGSGLRARFLFHERTGNLVIAWSGCDLKALREWDLSGVKDVSSVAHQYWGSLGEGQFKQALDFLNGILLSFPSKKVEVVGHSLGGGITAYVVAAVTDPDERVTGATFNGLGISERALKRYFTSYRIDRANRLITNVRCVKDPVYAGWLVKSRHFGLTYDIESEERVSHSLSGLIQLMEGE